MRAQSVGRLSAAQRREMLAALAAVEELYLTDADVVAGRGGGVAATHLSADGDINAGEEGGAGAGLLCCGWFWR